MHTEPPWYWSSRVVKFVASSIYYGLNIQDHKINTFIMFNELRNDISRNYLLSILVPIALPETIGQCLEMGLKKKKRVNM